MNVLFAFASGLLFGIGLIVAGMANPAKVIGFLDIVGKWDPSLAFVMAGAIAVGLAPFAVARKRTISLLGLAMHLPSARHIDRRLVIGNILFGIGWGLAGICPGPALVLLGAQVDKGVLFLLAMLAGMLVYRLVDRMVAHAARMQPHEVHELTASVEDE